MSKDCSPSVTPVVEQAAPFWHRPTEVEKGAYWHAYTGERGASLCGTYMLVGLGLPKDLRRKMPVTVRCGKCSVEWRKQGRK